MVVFCPLLLNYDHFVGYESGPARFFSKGVGEVTPFCLGYYYFYYIIVMFLYMNLGIL